MKEYFVYIMASKSGVLYTGMTGNLGARVYQHKQGSVKGFTSRYRAYILVYYESTTDPHAAISREKEIKKWRRSKKVDLIESMNPDWEDLSEGWYPE